VRDADLGARVDGLTCPVLWLDGADDRIVAPAAGRPGTVRKLADVGHLVPIEAPEAVAAAVTDVTALGRAT
jgi:pimeloyl-ACP methyl ester carboxylesterase